MTKLPLKVANIAYPSAILPFYYLFVPYKTRMEMKVIEATLAIITSFHLWY